MPEKTEGIYQFAVEKDPSCGYYSVVCWSNKPGERFTTYGNTFEEALENVVDGFLTMHDIKVSWWNRLLYSLMKY